MLAQDSKQYYSVGLFLPETRIKYPCYKQVPNRKEDAFQQMSLVPGGFRGLPPTGSLCKAPSAVLLVKNTRSATLLSLLHCISFPVSLAELLHPSPPQHSLMHGLPNLSFCALHCLCLPSYNLCFPPIPIPIPGNKKAHFWLILDCGICQNWMVLRQITTGCLQKKATSESFIVIIS